MRNLLVISGFVLAVVPVAAQTTNVANVNTLTFNTLGAAGTSPIVVDVAASMSFSAALAISGPAASPIILATAAAAVPGALNLGPNNFVDIDLATLTIVLDGTGFLVPSPFASFLSTNSLGSFSITVPNAFVNSVASTSGLQAALVNPAFTVGYNATAAFALTTPSLAAGSTTCNPAAAMVTAGDDTSTSVDITPSGGAPWFTFYGVPYGSLFVGSNGCLTALSFTTANESASALASSTGGAKICPYWDDFNFLPTVSPGSTLRAFISDTPGAEVAEFCWTGVREDGVANSGATNTFKATVTSSTITFDYGSMSAQDGLVGLSPGVAGTAGLSLNLSLGAGIPAFNLSGPPFVAPNQLFNATTANDLRGARLVFVLANVAGFPGVPTSVH